MKAAQLITVLLKELSVLGSSCMRQQIIALFLADLLKVHNYPLEKINQAIADASKRKGLEYTAAVF